MKRVCYTPCAVWVTCCEKNDEFKMTNDKCLYIRHLSFVICH